VSAVAAVSAGRPDRRGSWRPTWSMVSTRAMELRKRRGLLVALVVVDVAIPAIFLAVRLVAHAAAPKSYGPAGGYAVFSSLVAGVLYVFGFIVAATVGASAGSTDLSEGVFRHLVVTGRSRVALYLARIPAGLAIITAMVAAGFSVVCLVCCLAAPTRLSYDGVTLAPGMSQAGFEQWAATHVNEALCSLPSRNIPVPCGPHGVAMNKDGVVTVVSKGPTGTTTTTIHRALLATYATRVADQNYPGYSKQFLTPSIALMVQSGLWIELEAAVGFVVGLGLGSLIGQRTVTTVLLIVLELVLTPLFAAHAIPHLIDGERAVVGVAMAHLEPLALPQVFSAGGPVNQAGRVGIIGESAPWAWVVVAAWLAGWTGLGAWRMATRDA
jgi:hypothetical protein